MNDLILQIDAETDTYVALSSRFDSQIASGDILGAVGTVREAESISLRSADKTQQQIDLVDDALEECLPDELVELLELHRQENLLWQDVFEAQAKKNGLMAEALEKGPGHRDNLRLMLEAQEVALVEDQAVTEAGIVETRRMLREKEIFAGTVTPPRCD